MAAPKDREALWAYILEKHTLQGEDLRGAQLRGFSFCEVSLANADLRDANLEGAEFTNCDLSGAAFAGADISHACFVSAKAEKADFTRVTAIGTDFAMASLSHVLFNEAELERANFTEASVAAADFSGAQLTNTIFAHARIDNAIFASTFVGTILVRVDLSTAKLLENAHVEDVCVDQATLEFLCSALRAGKDVSAVLRFLGDADVELPSHLAHVAANALPRSADPSDLMPEFGVSVSVGGDVQALFQQTLDEATDERPLQRLFEAHPELIAVPLAANHRGWVVPQKRLGSEYVPDFLACGLTSLGYEWLGVEIESPTAPLFTADGEQSKQLRHAIRQVHDWRNWLQSNIDYARRPRQVDGLGLREISPELPGLILIGRRADLDAANDQRRRRLCRELRIEIRTYDYLVEACAKPAIARESLGGRR